MHVRDTSSAEGSRRLGGEGAEEGGSENGKSWVKIFTQVLPVRLNLAISNALQEQRENPSTSSSEWRRRIDAITSQAYYIENTLAPHSPAALDTGHCTLLDLHHPNNPANLCTVLGIPERDLVFPLGAQIVPALYQHPNVQLFLDLSNSTTWRQGLSDDQATEQCKQAAWQARANELAADAEEALEVVKRAPNDDASIRSSCLGPTFRPV